MALTYGSTITVRLTSEQIQLLGMIMRHLGLKTTSEGLRASIYRASHRLELSKPEEFIAREVR